MKISKSKQELARIISKNGGWSDGAEFAAQDKDGDVFKFDSKPVMGVSREVWMPTGNGRTDKLCYCTTIKGWHQTILSRAEYLHLYPAPDADGWIEWEGGAARPVEFGVLVDVKLANGEVINRVPANSGAEWRHCWGDTNIIAYRLHKPGQAGATDKLSSESVSAAKIALMSDSIEELVRKPTIEQLAADYRNKLDCANRKQDEADKANMDSDAALSELEAAIAEIGFAITPISAAEKEPELVITDWRDLRVGDVIEVTGSSNEDWGGVKGKELTIKVVRSDGASTGEWLVRDNTEFRIIRRP